MTDQTSDASAPAATKPRWTSRMLRLATLCIWLMAQLGCSPLSTQLRKQLNKGEYAEVLVEGDEWIRAHDEAPHDPAERQRVDLLVAEAHLQRVTALNTVAAYRWFVARYGVNPPYHLLAAQCGERHAEAVWVQEVSRADSRSAYKYFADTFPESQHAVAARNLEMQRAFAETARTVTAQQEFRQQYQAHVGFDAFAGPSREREMTAAFETASTQSAVAVWQKFRQDYATWPEAEGLLALASIQEAESALTGAILAGDVAGLDAVRAAYPHEPWATRADRALAELVTAPLRGAVAANASLSDAAVEDFFAYHRGRPLLGEATAEIRDRMRALAVESERSAPLRLYRLIYPDDPSHVTLRDLEADRTWQEARRTDDAESWARFVTWLPEDPRVHQAEARTLHLQTVARAAARWPRAQVSWTRTVRAGETELTIDVLDCEGNRVSGLTRDAFELYADGQPQPIIDFKGLEDDRPLDLIFAIDLSGSMDAERRAVQEAVAQFAETFRYRGRETRLGLVTFSDDVSQRHGAVNSVKQFQQWMQKLPDSSGGLSEDSVNALLTSGDLLKSSPAERVVVLLTDEDLQMNRGGAKALYGAKGGSNDRCARLLNVAHCIGKCTGPECLARCYGLLGPAEKTAMNRCVKRAGARACTAYADWDRRLQALASCVEPVADDSPLIGLLAERMAKARLRPYFVVPLTDQVGEHAILGYGGLARETQGRILPVPHDSEFSAPYTAALDDIADQLSKQYQIRYQPSTSGAAAIPAVVAHRQFQWSPALQLPGDDLVALVPQGTDARCPDLLLILENGVYQTEACGARWRRLEPGDTPRTWSLAAWHGDRVVLRDRATIVEVESKSSRFTPIDVGSGHPRDLHFDRDGYLWVLTSAPDGGHQVYQQASAGEPMVARDLARPKASEAEPAAGAPPTPMNLLIEGQSFEGHTRICVLVDPRQRRCTDDGGEGWFDATMSGLPDDGTIDAHARALSVPGRAGTAILATPTGGIWRTLDSGATWRNVQVPETVPPASAVSPAGQAPTAPIAVQPPTLTWFAGESPSICLATAKNVQCSRDLGLTWPALGRESNEVESTENQGERVLAAVGADLYQAHGGQLLRLDHVVARDIPSSAVYFTTDSDKFSPNLAPFLSALARKMLSDENLTLRIEGHADQRGSDEHNDDLALRRADNVAQEIIAQGIAERRVSVHGFGSRRPVRAGDRAADLARNRRVELVMTQRIPSTQPDVDRCGRPVAQQAVQAALPGG